MVQAVKISSAAEEDPQRHLAELAAEYAVEELTSYGSDPSPEHKKALRCIATQLSKQAFGKRERTAFSLPTGCGKSLSAVSFIKATDDLGLDISVVIGAETVEHLCKMKRDLIRQGVSSDSIGLLHSYRYGPNLDRESLKEGYASEPSTPKEEADSKQFLLVTHNRLKSDSRNVRDTISYKGYERNLIIWDESLVASDAYAIDWVRLGGQIGGFISSYEIQHRDATYNPREPRKALYLYLKNSKDIIQDQFDKIHNGNPEVTSLKLPEPTTPIAAMRRVAKSESHCDLVDELLSYADESTPLRAFNTGQQGTAIIGHEIRIQEDLDNVVILDASVPIRHLVTLDKSIKHQKLDFKKDYSTVTVNHWECAAGRGAIKNSFKQGSDNPYSAEVVDICQSIKADKPEDSILIVTFNEKDGLDVAGDTQKALRDHHIDPEELTPRGKKRINFLTWGYETSTNDYAHCRNIIFLGILHLPRSVLAAMMTGQKGDILAEVTQEEISYTQHSEQAHRIYQALSRGNSRNTINGKAGRMEVYLFHQRVNPVRELMDQIMPNLHWKKYNSKYLLEKTTKMETLAETLEELLNTQDGNKVPTSELRKLYEENNPPVSSTLWSRAVRFISENSFDWELERRSFVRI